MAELLEKAAVLRVIFDSVGKPATEIYQLVRELPTVTDNAADRVARLCCELCGVCPEGKKDPWGCEFLSQFEDGEDDDA